MILALNKDTRVITSLVTYWVQGKKVYLEYYYETVVCVWTEEQFIDQFIVIN